MKWRLDPDIELAKPQQEAEYSGDLWHVDSHE